MELKNTEKREHSIMALTVEVTRAEFESAKDKAFKKVGRNITIPGFRKGKAPRKMVEKLYGDGAFFEDGFKELYPDVLEFAVKQADIKPVGRSEVELNEPSEPGGLSVVCLVPVEPEVELGEYKGLEIEKPAVTVTEDDIQKDLERMAQRGARRQTVERPAQKNDTVDMDFDGSIEGVPFDGGKSEHYALTLGSGAFIPGFEDQLIGCSTGEERDVVITFPEDYHAKELAGKEAVFKCKINKIEETILPTLDDEFAKDVSDTCETLDALKEEIRERLTGEREQAAEHTFEERLLEAVAANMKADIPEAMIESQIDTLAQDFSYRVQMQGMTMDQYLQMIGADQKSFRAMFRVQAENMVKNHLALKKIVQLESITVSDEDIEQEYAKMAEQYKLDLDRVKTFVKPDALAEDLCNAAALKMIKEQAKVVCKSEAQ